MSHGVKNIVETLGEQKQHLQWYFPENHPEGEPGQGFGGLATDTEGNVIGIKSNQYRLRNNRCLPGVFVDDVYSMGGVSHTVGDVRRTGIEIEACVFDSKTGAIVDLRHKYPDDHDRIWSPELYKHTIEVQSDTSSNVKEAIRSLVSKFAISLSILGPDSLIDPSAAWMGSVPNLDIDKTDHPYVDVMIEALSKHGGLIEDFVGHGMHQHIEASAEQVHHIARYLQLICPIISAGMSASPFMHGKTSPSLYSIFEAAEGSELIRDIDTERSGRWEDVRNIARIFGSSSGGVGYFTQETRDDVLRLGDVMARDGKVTTVSRGYGMHSDVRVRYDMPNNCSTVELCHMDNPLGSEQVIEAFADLNYALVERLSEVIESGDDSIDKMHEDFIGIFGARVHPNEMTSTFDRVVRNNVMVSKYGRNAKIESVHDGSIVTIPELMGQILDFAGGRMSQSSIQVIWNSLLGRTSVSVTDFLQNPSGTGSEVIRNYVGDADDIEPGWNINLMKEYREYILRTYEADR